MITSAALATSAAVPRISAPTARRSSAGSAPLVEGRVQLVAGADEAFGHGEGPMAPRPDKPHVHLISRF